MVASLGLIAFLAVTSASAQEKRLKRSDLPPAVQKTVDELSHGAKVRGYASELEAGQLEYEVELIANGRVRDVTIAPDGSVLETEEEVALEALPAAVRAALHQQAGARPIVKVGSLTKQGRLGADGAQARTRPDRSEIHVRPDGNALPPPHENRHPG